MFILWLEINGDLNLIVYQCYQSTITGLWLAGDFLLADDAQKQRAAKAIGLTNGLV